MAKLSAKTRRRLPSSAFAYPSTRKYPIYDRSHARNALARASSSKTSGSYATVAAAVNRRFPGMAKGRKSSSTRRRSPARRRRR